MSQEILAPGIVRFDFSKKLADELVFAFKSIKNWDNAKFYLDNSHQEIKPRRKSLNLPLNHIDPDLNNKVSKTVEFTSNLYKAMYGINFDSCEGFDVLRYDVGDYFLPHYDGNINKYRTVSILIYLNTNEYSGGETVFHNFNLSVNPESPSMLFFPSNYPYSHSANKIESGTKYIIVSWFSDLPPGKKLTIS